MPRNDVGPSLRRPHVSHYWQGRRQRSAAEDTGGGRAGGVYSGSGDGPPLESLTGVEWSACSLGHKLGKVAAAGGWGNTSPFRATCKKPAMNNIIPAGVDCERLSRSGGYRVLRQGRLQER